MLGLPFKETLDTYPSLDSIMRVVEQEDLREKVESFFEELMGEIEIKNAIAAKVYQNKSLEVTNSKEETEITKEFENYKKESKRLMDFSWDHEGLGPYPSPERPKQQRDPKEKGTQKEGVKCNETLNRGPKGKENQEEREEPLKRAKEKLASPKPNETTPKELEKDSDVKRGHPKEGNGVDKNTEQWINDQNKFWEKKRGNLEETMPKVFEPQGPVKILQRGK